MNLYAAIKTRQISSAPLSVQQLHVKTCDGKLGVVEKIERNETRGYLMVTLRHFNGEAFPHEYVASVCELLDRTEP